MESWLTLSDLSYQKKVTMLGKTKAKICKVIKEQLKS
jgi:hypothetical protein